MKEYRMISVNGVNLQIAPIGNGYPIFFIHGGPGGCHRVFGDYLDGLSDQFRLIYYDQRGQGTSEEVDPKSMYMDNFVNDLYYLADKLGYDKYMILGHSFGGFVALEFALKYPEKLSHLILINTADSTEGLQEYREDSIKRRTLQYEGFKELYEEHVRLRTVAYEKYKSNYDEAINAFKKAFQILVTKDLMSINSEGISKFKEVIETTEFNLNTIFEVSENILSKYDVSDKIKNINTPTLIISGKREGNLNPQKSIDMANKIPNSTLLLFDDASHNSYVEKPKEIIEAIRSLK